MRQVAPEPSALKTLVEALRYKPNWSFRLIDVDRGEGSEGLTLLINITGPDTNDFEREVSVNHYMIVPAASFNEQSWQRWLFDQVLLVEQHEACEFFKIAGHQPYAPNHGPGYDPYTIRDLTTAEEREINFLGAKGARR